MTLTRSLAVRPQHGMSSQSQAATMRSRGRCRPAATRPMSSTNATASSKTERGNRASRPDTPVMIRPGRHRASDIPEGAGSGQRLRGPKNGSYGWYESWNAHGGVQAGDTRPTGGHHDRSRALAAALGDRRTP